MTLRKGEYNYDVLNMKVEMCSQTSGVDSRAIRNGQQGTATSLPSQRTTPPINAFTLYLLPLLFYLLPVTSSYIVPRTWCLVPRALFFTFLPSCLLTFSPFYVLPSTFYLGTSLPVYLSWTVRPINHQSSIINDVCVCLCQLDFPGSRCKHVRFQNHCRSRCFAMASRTAHLIAKFDQVEMQLASIRIAEADHPSAPVRPEDDCLEEDLIARCVLPCAEREVSLLEKRIHRNEHPRLFYYFVCRRGSKVARMRDELRIATLEKERRSADVSSAGAAALKQRRQQRELSERATRRKQLESESRSLFNSVVDAQPPTAALEQCTTHRQQCITEMVPEQLLLCVERPRWGDEARPAPF